MDRTDNARASAGAPAPRIRRVGPDSAPEAVAILLEVSAWSLGRGIEVWTEAELPVTTFESTARAGELLLGFSGERAAATMTLQALDTVYWPEAAPGHALYLHKIGVRREFAGRGWLEALVAFAADDARARRIPLLRLDTLAGTALQPLYERHGFRTLDEPPIIVRGRALIRMERRL